MSPLLDVRDLSVQVEREDGAATVVDGVSLAIAPGETLCLVGESGCGKSMTALALLRLLVAPVHVTGGQVWFHDRDLLAASESELRRIRGNRIAMVFQEPMTALNPVFTIGNQIAEVIRCHQHRSAADARTHTLALLRRVGMGDPEARIDQYPHQLSGGMKQRALIAMALACRPEILIADEPTTALDVTIQAQILDLLRGLSVELGMALLLITHDLGVVAEMADRVVVMYAGRVVETADVRTLFRAPRHPYTLGLFRSLPRGARRLLPIPGSVPEPFSYPSGCRFRPRCSLAESDCEALDPRLRRLEQEHEVACHHPPAGAPPP